MNCLLDSSARAGLTTSTHPLLTQVSRRRTTKTKGRDKTIVDESEITGLVGDFAVRRANPDRRTKAATVTESPKSSPETFVRIAVFHLHYIRLEFGNSFIFNSILCFTFWRVRGRPRLSNSTHRRKNKLYIAVHPFT